MMCNICLVLLILAPSVEESITNSLVETVEEQNLDDTLYEEVRWKIEAFFNIPKTLLLLLLLFLLPTLTHCNISRSEVQPRENWPCLCCHPVKTQT